MQKGVDVSHAGPVPAGCTGQHLRQAARVVPLTVEPMVPKDLVICPLQPEAKTDGEEDGWDDIYKKQIKINKLLNTFF